MEFGAQEAPVRFPMGRGGTWAAGDVVLKRIDDEREAIWVAELASRVQQRGFRLPRPIAARDARWVVDGWTAWTRVAGEHSTTRWSELLTAAGAFHEAVANVSKPEFIDRRIRGADRARAPDRWRVADAIAWAEAPAGDLEGVAHLDRLLAARRAVDLPSQLIHGDLVGNVLFRDGRPPAVIDLSLYWRPVGYSAALAVGDALTWEGATTDILRLIEHFAEWRQLLLRAVLFRIVVNELARRAEPERGDLSEHYREIVELVLSL